MILYPLTKFQYHTFFTSQDIKQFVFLNSSIDTFKLFIRHMMTFILLRNMSVNFPYKFSNDRQGEKEVKRKVLKTEYLENKKNF